MALARLEINLVRKHVCYEEHKYFCFIVFISILFFRMYERQNKIMFYDSPRGPHQDSANPPYCKVSQGH